MEISNPPDTESKITVIKMFIKLRELDSNLDFSLCFQIRKGVRQGYISSPCLFNLYAENIMRNARLDKAQAGIKISGKNINNLR